MSLNKRPYHTSTNVVYFLEVLHTSYNSCSICIRSTKKIKWIPHLCTLVYSYVLWKVLLTFGILCYTIHIVVFYPLNECMIAYQMKCQRALIKNEGLFLVQHAQFWNAEPLHYWHWCSHDGEQYIQLFVLCHYLHGWCQLVQIAT